MIKKLLMLVALALALALYLSGCNNGSNASLNPRHFDTAYFCATCHGWDCPNPLTPNRLRDNRCLMCHAIMVCKRGNDWKTKLLKAK